MNIGADFAGARRALAPLVVKVGGPRIWFRPYTVVLNNVLQHGQNPHSGKVTKMLHGRLVQVGKTFPIVDTCLSCEDIARQSCGMVPRWRLFGDFLPPVFSASCAQHVSDLHSKFTLRPHHVWKYGRHPISDR